MSVRNWVKTIGSKTRAPVLLPGQGGITARSVPARHPGRAQGDKARDLRDWASAILAYRDYLSAVPEDAAIWVQLGHALKETGDYAEAETAYRRALELTPQDSDVLLQLGHLLKLRGRRRAATRLYEASLEADVMSPAYQELAALGQIQRAEASRQNFWSKHARTQTYFQIDDVLAFLSSHKTVSGIQRVQIEVIRDVLSRSNEVHDTSYAFVYTEPFNTRIWEADRQILRNIVEYLDEPDIEHSAIVRMIGDIRAKALRVHPQPGSTFVMLGAFWAAVNNSNVLAMLKEAGISLGVYFYDLIPVTHPELCDPILANCFTQFLAEALCLVDFALAISEFTAQEVRRFIQREEFPPIEVVVVPLAHTLSTSRTQKGAYLPAWSEATAALQDREFVLYVSTIEARKNHKFAFDVWKMLISEGIEVPDLVFVGRYGWRVSEFIQELTATDFLDGRVHILHNLSDHELETLYRQCQFTVFTSIVEGWGLPVGESLGYGKLCVSSNTSSMPEVGGDLVVYIDPLNVRDGLETTRQLITNRSLVEQRELAIRENFVPRTWPEVAARLLDAVATLSAKYVGIPGNSFVPRIEPREHIQIADYSPFADPFSDRLPKRSKLRAKRLLLGTTWHCPENFGAWLEGSEGRLKFSTPLPAGENVIILLEFTSTPSAAANALEISELSGNRVIFDVPAGTNFSIRFVCPTNAKSEVELTIYISGEVRFNFDDPRAICVGLVSLTYVAEKDAAGRAELLEREFFDRHLPEYVPDI
jgi:glycosyltransferase involved in cell wall biosynthesis